MSPQPPALGAAAARPGWRSTLEGLRFIRRSQAVQGAYVIDVNAMVFGMPRALFPALAATVFGGGANHRWPALRRAWRRRAARGADQRLGRAGATARARRHLRVLIWGASHRPVRASARWLPLAMALLAVAGWADVLSAVFRNTIIQFAGPDGMRGRLMGVQMAVVAGGPRLGDLEAGAVATAFGDTVSVVSGGLACVAGALLLARALPGFTRPRSALHGRADEPEEVAEAAVQPE